MDAGTFIEYDRTSTTGVVWGNHAGRKHEALQALHAGMPRGYRDEGAGDGRCYNPMIPSGVPQNSGDTGWMTGRQPDRKVVFETKRYDQLPLELVSDFKLQGKTTVVVDLFQPFHQVLKKDEHGRDVPDPDDDFFKRIPEIKFVVDGIKITWPGNSTAKPTSNPAAILYWYLTERTGIRSSGDRLGSVHGSVERLRQGPYPSRTPAFPGLLG